MKLVPTAPRAAAALVAGAALLVACGGDADPERDRPARDSGDVAAAGERGGPASDAAGPGGGDAGEPVAEGEPSGDAAGPLHRPESEAMSRRAPDAYRVTFATTEGEFTVRVRREWAPRGADRLYNLTRHGFYDGARFFRVIDGFVAQFGLSGRPRLDRLWREHPIPDDPVRLSNERGTVSFASSGEDSRTTQLFVNLGDNTRLDSIGFAPVGRVVEGMEVVDALYAGYGEGAPRGAGPSQGRIVREGNAYLQEEFPKLDYIEATEVREEAAGDG
jgi:peptidyl-prolyl cis-trans isomerase A (cyclophilin A)